MTHHITEEIDLNWLAEMDHFFLIRDPARIVASYAVKTGDSQSVFQSLKREAEIFERVSDLKGTRPAVIDAQDVLSDPRGILTALCGCLGIPFDETMLSWPAGRRDSDGVWAPHWYQSVEGSTGFRPPAEQQVILTPAQQEQVEACAPHYQTLWQQRLSIG